jgi:hypothetical protein
MTNFSESETAHILGFEGSLSEFNMAGITQSEDSFPVKKAMDSYLGSDRSVSDSHSFEHTSLFPELGIVVL